jgi:hypothetical protein
MRPVKTIPGMGEGRIKENDGWGEFNYGYIAISFVNVTMHPQCNNSKKAGKDIYMYLHLILCV